MRFEKVADYFEKIEAAPGRLEMTDLLAKLFEEASAEEIGKIVFLAQGKLAPDFEQIETGLGEKLVEEALCKVSGYARSEVEKLFKEKGDLGLVAQQLVSKKKQQSLSTEELTVKGVFEDLKKTALASGSGSQELKLKMTAKLLNSAAPKEAVYIARFLLANLRLGIGDPTIMDALAQNSLEEFKKENKKLVEELKEKYKEEAERDRRVRARLRERIEEKYNIHPDLGAIAEALKRKGLGGLKEIKITPGIPIRPTLAERLPSAEEIVEKLGKCAVEAKYDGFRLAIHKDSEKVKIFSRRMENMTSMFPDIVEAVKKQIAAKQAIFEGEALAFNETTSTFYPFQITMQRKRKYGIEEKAEEFPLKLFAFDLLFVDGKNIMAEPFEKRREELGKIIKKGDKIELTKSIVTDDPKAMNEFFEENVESGLEGIIAKDLNAKYIAGARKFAWIKLKRSYRGELSDTIDAVVLGYYKGKGIRTEFGLGGLLVGVYDKKDDSFKSIARIGTGMSEQMLSDLEKMLSKIRVSKKPGRVDSEVEPDFWTDARYVIEVRADEITKSPLHTAARGKDGIGLALRFPRLVSVRSDKKPEEATTVKEIQEMFKNQKQVMISEAPAAEAERKKDERH
jgi:DNA ligase-1